MKVSTTHTFIRLLSYALTDRKLVRSAVALLLIATAADVCSPLLIKAVIDNHLVVGDWSVMPLALLGCGYVALQLINALANYYQALQFSTLAVSGVQALRLAAFARVLRMPLSFFDRTPVGALVSRLTNDTEYAREMYVDVLGTYIQGTVRIIGIFIVMALLDWRLMLVCMLFMPFIAALMVIYQRLSTPRFQRVRSFLSDINARIYESVQGIKVIQLLHQEARFAKQFAATADEHFHARMHNLKLDAILLRPLVDLLHMFTLAGLLYLFGYRSFDTPVAVGVIYVFVNYLARFVEPMIEMTQRLSLFQQAVVSGQRVFDLIDDAVTHYPEHSAACIEHGTVTLRDVTFSYDGRRDVLSNMSFRVPAGSFCAIVGHTGSGKSTIANLLLRFYDVNSGDVLIDDHAVEIIGAEELRSKVGIVQQDPVVFGGSIADNIALGRKLDRAAVEHAGRRAGLHEFIAELPQGYDTQLDERGGNLSTGQRQLLSLARTLAGNPKILILDEATAHVDSRTEAHVQRALAQLRGQITLIVIAHRLSTIQAADNILVLHHGTLTQQGTHTQLLAHAGVYRNLYQLQELEQRSQELESAEI
ncbi:MAG: ATP-binding cassette domain-containing protein [Gammaproteobacteria bacterium]|nr:ATP-binding cassette domain-containing protein [Gammaproteobacteria bacterium]